MSEDANLSSMSAICSQQLYTNCSQQKLRPNARSEGAKRVSKDEGLTLQDTHTQVGFTQLAYLKCRSRVNQRSVCAPQHAAERDPA